MYKPIKDFLRTLTDDDFLVTISYLDIHNHDLWMKGRYWNLFMYNVRKISRTNYLSIMDVVKECLFWRLRKVTQRAFMKFFMGRIRSGFQTFQRKIGEFFDNRESNSNQNHQDDDNDNNQNDDNQQPPPEQHQPSDFDPTYDDAQDSADSEPDFDYKKFLAENQETTTEFYDEEVDLEPDLATLISIHNTAPAILNYHYGGHISEEVAVKAIYMLGDEPSKYFRGRTFDSSRSTGTESRSYATAVKASTSTPSRNRIEQYERSMTDSGARPTIVEGRHHAWSSLESIRTEFRPGDNDSSRRAAFNQLAKSKPRQEE